MKLVTALSTAAFVLVPAVGLAQEPANGTGNTKDEPGVVGKVIEKITGRSPDTKEGNKSGDRDSPAKSVQTTPILQRSKRPENSRIPGYGQLRLQSWRT